MLICFVHISRMPTEQHLLTKTMSWTKFLKGDSDAFALLYNNYIDDLVRYGIRFHADKALVVDCIHDLFVDLYGNTRIAQQVNVKFYLFSSLRRRILKTRKQQAGESLETVQEDLLAVGSHELNFILKEDQRLLSLRVKEEIERLPKRQQEILYLKYYMDFSYENIAEIMGVSVESCRTLSYRAVKSLKTQIPAFELTSILILIFSK